MAIFSAAATRPGIEEGEEEAQAEQHHHRHQVGRGHHGQGTVIDEAEQAENITKEALDLPSLKGVVSRDFYPLNLFAKPTDLGPFFDILKHFKILL